MARLCAVILLAVAALHAQPQPKPANVWAPIEFLLGDWVGEGGGGPGQGAGEFSFHKDLDGKVAVRKNFAEYPATKNRPALRHDDLMIVYPGSSSGALRAIYFDNDGYVIHYSVQGTKDSAVFLSDVGSLSAAFPLNL